MSEYTQVFTRILDLFEWADLTLRIEFQVLVEGPVEVAKAVGRTGAEEVTEMDSKAEAGGLVVHQPGPCERSRWAKHSVRHMTC